MIIDGKKISQEIKDELKKEVEELKAQGIILGLAVVAVGDDPASQVYIRNKERACEYLGIKSFTHKLPANAPEEEVFGLIKNLNVDPNVQGILVQLPLPEHLDPQKIIFAVKPEKDVDGFHPQNIGKTFSGERALPPCTPAGIVELLKRCDIEIAGQHCVVVGRSNIVGKPLALMLLNESGTVTICHSKTKNLVEITKQADILICAVGRPNFITADMIKESVTLIDVGINHLADGALCGDIDFAGCETKARAITPVPGGVGPMTIAMLMKNCVTAGKQQK